MCSWMLPASSMGRTTVFLVVAVLIIGPAISLSAVGDANSTGGVSTQLADERPVIPTPSVSDNVESRGTQPALEPGAQFVGVVGAHHEQHAGAVDEQATAVRISGADSPSAKAEVIATVHHDKREQLDRLAERRQEVERAAENGSVSESEYRARLAILDAELRSVERVAIQLEEAADEIALSILLDAGVDLASIEDLRTRAQELQGSELTTIAPSFGRDSIESGTDTTPAPPGGNTTETPIEGDVSTVVADADGEVQAAQERVSEANQTIDGTLVTDSVSELLTRARENLSAAERTLTAARAAREDGDDHRAVELANEAITFARTAIDHADRAIDEATGIAEISR